MRILYIAPRYYPHIGGVEYVVKSTAERLVKHGHEVTVVAGEPSIGSHVEEELNGVHVVRWPTWSPSGAYHVPRRRRLFEEALKDILARSDVIHVHSIHSVMTYYAWRVWKQSKGVSFILTPYYHGSGHTVLRRFLWLAWRGIVGRIVRDADKVHTVSRLEAQLVARDFGVQAIPIENGVEEDVKGLEWKPGTYILYAGRIEKYKNIHVAAEIVSVLNKNYGFNLDFLVIGDGPYKARLADHLRRLQINHKILPFQPYNEYLRILSHAYAFSLLSEKESYSQSVNEANAIGVPVVIVEPWGGNFKGRGRTLILPRSDLKENRDKVVERIAEFLKSAPSEPRSSVPTWDEVVKIYMNKLYT